MNIYNYVYWSVFKLSTSIMNVTINKRFNHNYIKSLINFNFIFREKFIIMLINFNSYVIYFKKLN